jgi:2-methylcitrate dehydratase PrpD
VEAFVAYCAADGRGEASPIGRTEALAASAAVAVDCLSSAALAYDDIHFETTLHPAGPVAAAIHGLARARKVGGRDALEALRIGMEVECRIAIAMFGRDTGAANGWYPTGLAGGIGAAAAVGRLLGQEEATLATSMALAAAKAAGTRGTHGAMSAYWPPAVAAEAGYSAAMMADLGFTCSHGALSGSAGVIQQIAPSPDVEAALAGLGSVHLCETTACKIYPYGFITYAAISCALSLGKWREARDRRLVRLRLHVSPTCARLGGKQIPMIASEAHVSLAYVVARVLSDPELAFAPVPEDFAPEEPFTNLAHLVDLVSDPELGNEQSRLVAEYEDGGRLTVQCDAAPGTKSNPVGSGEIGAKFLRLVTPILGKVEAESLLARFDDLEHVEDLNRVQ